MSNQIYKKSVGSATVYVVRHKDSRITQLKIYINSEDATPVVLKDRITKKINQDRRARRADYTSTLTFKKLAKVKPIVDSHKKGKKTKNSRFYYFSYILPGINHNITIVTPENDKILITRRFKSSLPTVEPVDMDYDVGSVRHSRRTK